ncbi:MAG: methyltransferase domain-containing protein [Acidobacteria bacterium]|nr:MAG: methyltransferase domain-containing protein [Acidobacteriota bacterium]
MSANAGLLMQVALAHRSSAVLFAASELDVFSKLSAGSMTAADVAKACNAKPDPTRFVLDACVTIGMIERDGDKYKNSPTAEFFLVRGKGPYIGDGLKYAEDLYPAWGRVAELMRTGKPVMPPETILGDDPEKTRAFVLAMHERAKGIGAVLPHGADLTGRKHLLDIGGGPGTYSVGLVRQTPGLRSTVLDRPGVLAVTKELVAEQGFADRVGLRPADYLKDDFGTGYDVALLSGMMHRETPESCQLLLRKAFAALDPGGLVMVSDVFFDDDSKQSPPFATFFALNMMLTAEHGTCHARTEMAAWMTRAGFVNVEIKPLPPPNPHTLLFGTKPA